MNTNLTELAHVRHLNNDLSLWIKDPPTAVNDKARYREPIKLLQHDPVSKLGGKPIDYFNNRNSQWDNVRHI